MPLMNRKFSVIIKIVFIIYLHFQFETEEKKKVALSLSPSLSTCPLKKRVFPRRLVLSYEELRKKKR